MTRQLCGVNHYNKSSIAKKHMFPSILKSKETQIEDKIETYFSHHHLALWAVAFVGVPVGVLLAIGFVTAIFGMAISGITSLI